ncbi:MAG: hypothetical protein AAF197_11390, partial [Pseudomonadota bacterium]
MNSKALNTIESDQAPVDGDILQRDGKICIFYNGYWIRYYPAPPNTMTEKKKLIYALQKRVFHHTEQGINSPGWRADIARQYYEREKDPARKRVNAAMLAGSLFNRATDIFTNLVNLELKGIHVDTDNPLMRQCESCFMEALELGKQVKHFSGEEGVDELWGEPFKVFSMTTEKFFKSRYVKLSQTFAAIDEVIDRQTKLFANLEGFEGVIPLLEDLRETSKTEVETMRRDEAIYLVWPRYVAAKEAVIAFKPAGLDSEVEKVRPWEDGLRLLKMGHDVIAYLSGVRVPMPLTTKNFIANCDLYEKT